MREIKANPEMKQAFDTLLRNVPEYLRDNVISQVADQTRRVIAQSRRMGGVTT